MINAARLSRGVVTIGGSAGAVESLIELVGKLPADFGAAIAVVVHLNRFRESKLPAILGRVARLPVAVAADGAALHEGTIHVAPPDYHLLVGPTLALRRGAAEHYHRPAIDPLFRSAAETFSDRVVGVLLSGSTSDGVSGGTAIKRAGGVVLVEDPRGAQHPRLPLSALHRDGVDAALSIDQLASVLSRLARGEVVEEA
jgi:two-component system chemotaxis response regulator CheB